MATNIMVTTDLCSGCWYTGDLLIMFTGEVEGLDMALRWGELEHGVEMSGIRGRVSRVWSRVSRACAPLSNMWQPLLIKLVLSLSCFS